MTDYCIQHRGTKQYLELQNTGGEIVFALTPDVAEASTWPTHTHLKWVQDALEDFASAYDVVPVPA